MTSVVVLLIAFAVFLVVGVPFAWSLSFSSIMATIVMGNIPVMLYSQRMFTGTERYTLLSIFFFLLAGAIMQHGGISKRLVNFARAWFGHITGGLSLVVIVACMFFAALSGSSIATTAAIGAMLYPELLKAKYPEGYAAALPVSGGTLGIVIPPSIVFVLYGTTTNTSVSNLLISGAVPGIMAGIAMCIYAYIYATHKKFPKAEGFSFKTTIFATKDAFWALLMPFIILGGIYLGVFTPTESASVAVLYGFSVSVLIYRELTLQRLMAIMIDAAKSTANILLLVAAATLFGWVLTANNVPVIFTEFMSSFIHNKVSFLLCVNILMIILGMLMDSGPIILIVGPLLMPMAMRFGVDPVHLGCIIVFNLAVGQATPPFGCCLFSATSVTGQDIITLSKNSLPFVVILFACVFLTTFIPAIPLGLIWLMN